MEATLTPTENPRLSEEATVNGEDVAALVSTHLPRAFRVARRITGNNADADDAVQDAFVRVIRKLRQHQPRRREAWILAIVVNTARQHLRQRGRRHRHEQHAARSLHRETSPED